MGLLLFLGILTVAIAGIVRLANAFGYCLFHDWPRDHNDAVVWDARCLRCGSPLHSAENNHGW